MPLPSSTTDLRVLVVDDDAVSRTVLARAVRALGHEIITAVDGEDGWSRYQSEAPHVVVTDWLMPRLDGPGLCRRIRASETDGYTYVVLATGLDERDHAIEGMDAGADDFLTKPVSEPELRARLIAAERVTGLHQRLKDQQEELAALNAQLGRAARTDPLTGLSNRMRLEEDLSVTQGRMERYGQQFCVALFDIDDFKAVNDRRGHLAGDAVLRKVAMVLRGTVRVGDGVYRFGGEEFLCVFPELSAAEGRATAERILGLVRRSHSDHLGSRSSPVTISGGVASTEMLPGANVHELIRLADTALYRAKAAGRDCVKVARIGDGAPNPASAPASI
ncbi:MAG: diguanylate cyclase [Acidimicrobiales bacterium]